MSKVGTACLRSLWNTNYIKMSDTLSTFKARLKTHFIDSHSSSTW